MPLNCFPDFVYIYAQIVVNPIRPGTQQSALSIRLDALNAFRYVRQI